MPRHVAAAAALGESHEAPHQDTGGGKAGGRGMAVG